MCTDIMINITMLAEEGKEDSIAKREVWMNSCGHRCGDQSSSLYALESMRRAWGKGHHQASLLNDNLIKLSK